MWKKGAAAVLIALMAVSFTLPGCSDPPRDGYAFILPDDFHGWVCAIANADGEDIPHNHVGQLVVIVPSTGIAKIRHPMQYGAGVDSFATKSGSRIPYEPTSPAVVGVRAQSTFSIDAPPQRLQGLTFFVGTKDQLNASDRKAFLEFVLTQTAVEPEAARLPPSDVGIYRYEAGAVAQEEQLSWNHRLVAPLQDWLDDAPQESGWRNSRINYAPSLVIATGEATINFTGDLVVLNHKQQDGWTQSIRTRQPADDALLNELRAALAASSQEGRGHGDRDPAQP